MLQGYVHELLLQTPVVPVGPPVHSELAQQAGAAAPTQRLVPAQLRKLLLHEMPQDVPLQVAWPLAGGTGHCWQVGPQYMLSLARQNPLQLWSLPMHWPMQAMLLSMQAPWQMYWFELVHVGIQLTPSQLTLPPVGAEHAGPHDVAPQVLRSLLKTQWLLHRW